MLLVEDDPAIAASLEAAMAGTGISIVHHTTGRAALSSLPSSGCDAVLLDLGLPDMDGLDVCREIRAVSSVPIIIVSARGDELDRVLGLELGADDYVVKPFSQREVLARLKAVTRRSGQAVTGAIRSPSGRLVIDEPTHKVTVDGEDVVLTPKEFDLLAFLAAEPGIVKRRTEILEHVWDSNWYGTTKTLDVHVASLRKKIGHPGWIQAIRGVGFKFEEDAPQDGPA